MVEISWPASDATLLDLAWEWVDVLAKGDYEKVFREIGYARAFGGGSDAIRREIERYRDETYFPGESLFRVTDRRNAKSGNPHPVVRITRYVPTESLPLVAALEIGLPVNGKWSRLEVHFVVFVRDVHMKDMATFSLEDFFGPHDLSYA